MDTDRKFRIVFEDICTALKCISGHLIEVTTKDSQFRNITYLSTKHKQSWVRIEELIDISYKIPRFPNMLGISH